MTTSAEQLAKNADWLEARLLDQQGIDSMYRISPKEGIYRRFPNNPEIREQLYDDWSRVRKDYKVRMDGHFAIVIRSIVRNMREAAENLGEAE